MVDDVQAIKNVVLSYVELLDVGDLSGAAAVFARATVRTHDGSIELRGAEPFERFLAEGVRLYDGIPSTKHLVTNMIVEIDDDRRAATARSYFTALQARPELPLQAVLAGRFHDRLESDGDHWHIVERVIHTDLVGDVSSHLGGPRPS